jgi:hypothetical protein
MSNNYIICTEDEMLRLVELAEADADAIRIDLQQLFDVLCEYYGVDPYWSPNDVY